MEQPVVDAQNQAMKVAQLVATLQARFGISEGVEGEDGAEPLKYAIYARKSTDAAEKQERSIGDQIGECKLLADRCGLRWVEVVHEEKSAMVADKRPLFRALLEKLRAGTIDGIIAWAPDRLARNMKEGGEIIDMLDHGDIKDLRFANGHTFTNTPSGKMLLGIAFIMAKEFSDTHSQNVTRAIRRKTEEGKWAGSHIKHGYYKDKDHFLRPDGENFDLIKQAFDMRLQGDQLAAIAAFLTTHGYPVTTKHTKHRDLVIDDRWVSDLLRDPTYAGALVFGKQIVNLFDKYDFVPAVDSADLERLFKADGIKKSFKLTEVVKPRGSIKADLMRGMVVCDDCHHSMSTGITPKQLPSGTKHYFYFRCDTHGCKSRGKSVRAKVIMDAAYAYLARHPLTRKGYDHYVAEMERKMVESGKETERTIKSFTVQKQHEDARVADMKELAREAKGDKVLLREYQADMKKHLGKSKELAEKIQKLIATKLNAKGAILAFEDFHELFQNLASYIQKVDAMSDLDFIMRKLFMNFTVKGGKVAEITQNSPFRELCLDAELAMVTLRGFEPRFAP